MASQRAIIIVNIAPPIKLEINTTLCHVSDEVNPDPEQHIKYGIHYKAIFENNDIDQFVSENDKLLNKDNTLLVYADIGSDRVLYDLLIHVLKTLSPKVIHKKVYIVSVREFEVSDQTVGDNNIEGFRVTNFKNDTFFEVGGHSRVKISSSVSMRHQRIKLDGTYYSVAQFGGDTSLPIRTVFEPKVVKSLGNHVFGVQNTFPAVFTPPPAFPAVFTPPPAFPAVFTPPPAFPAVFTPPPAFPAVFTPPQSFVTPEKGRPIVRIDLYDKIADYVERESILNDLSATEKIDTLKYVMINCASDLRIGRITDERELYTAVAYYVGRYKLQLILRLNLKDYDEDARVKTIYKKIMDNRINTKEEVMRELGDMKKRETVKSSYFVKAKVAPPRNKLTCQWWFERFFDTIFDCGKGKIFQSGETCYLTATLNAILLSNVVKYILINKMKTVMEDEASKRYIITPLTQVVSTCVRTLYMYRILYNMICSEKYGDGISIESPGGDKIIAMDLMSIDSTKFFCTEDKNGCRGSGGQSRGTSYVMLLESGVPFVVALKSEPGQFRLPNVSIVDHIRKAVYMFGGNIFKDLESVQTVDFDRDSVDIILYIDDTELEHITKKDKLSRAEELYDLGFEVDTCTISYNVAVHGSTQHSIAGFSCDGDYRFYDNALNVTIPIDWRKGLDAIKYDFGQEFREFSYILFDMAFYVNTKKIAEYLSNGTCPSQ